MSTIDCNFHEAWVLWRLAPPGSALAIVERQELLLKCIFELISKFRPGVIAASDASRYGYLSQDEFDSLQAEVAVGCLARLHVGPRSYYWFGFPSIAKAFEQARQRHFRQARRSSPTEAIERAATANESAVLDEHRAYRECLRELFDWEVQELEAVVEFVFGPGASDLVALAGAREKFVRVVTPPDAAGAQVSSREILDLYLSGWTMNIMPWPVGCAVGTVYHRIQAARVLLAEKTRPYAVAVDPARESLINLWHAASVRKLKPPMASPPKRIDRRRYDRWEAFYRRIVGALPTDWTAYTIARRAPTMSLGSLRPLAGTGEEWSLSLDYLCDLANDVIHTMFHA